MAKADNHFQKSALVGMATFESRRDSDDEANGLTNKAAAAAVTMQYAPAVVFLFGNMITPALILDGANIPNSFASRLAFDGDKDKAKFAKRECGIVSK